jgi:hypothetical protein
MYTIRIYLAFAVPILVLYNYMASQRYYSNLEPFQRHMTHWIKLEIASFCPVMYQFVLTALPVYNNIDAAMNPASAESQAAV